jgi:hypothetical protein
MCEHDHDDLEILVHDLKHAQEKQEKMIQEQTEVLKKIAEQMEIMVSLLKDKK